jgi:hypothetical protein
MENTVTRLVLADSDGIDVYHKDSEYLNHVILRANSNRHRHAVVAFVELDEADDRAIQALLDGANESGVNNICPEDKYINYATALKLLKERAKSVRLCPEISGNYRMSWMLIPNRDLDPYH